MGPEANPSDPRCYFCGGSRQDRRGSYIGILTFLLPFMDQQNIFDPIPANEFKLDYLGSGWWSVQELLDAAENKLPTYLCPTDPGNPGDYAIAVLNCYRWTLEAGLVRDQGRFGRTNYVSVNGVFSNVAGYRRTEGMFQNRSEHPLRDVTDGTSNTIVVGEATGGDRYDHPWIGPNNLPVYWGIGENWWQFGSHHSGGVTNFLLGDGSVRGLSPSIDRGTYRNLAGIHDGNIVGQF